MKKLWNRFDTSVLGFFLALLFVLITVYFNFWLALSELLVLLVMVIAKAVYTKKVKDKLLYRSNQFSVQFNRKDGGVFEELTVACCIIAEDGEILWLNNSFKEGFDISKDDSRKNINELLKRDCLPKVITGRGFKVKVDKRYFSVYSNEFQSDEGNFYLLYFFDETKLRLTEKEYYDTRPSIMLSLIDNAEEIYQNFKESDCAAIFSKLEQTIDTWVSSYGGLCRKFSNVRMLIFIEERGLSKMIADKFSILEQIRNFTYDDKPCDVTLSIGVGKESSLSDSNNSAKQALDMAQSRGGDQVAIKHEAQYKFFGGVSEGFEKRNKVRVRLIAKTVTEIIKESDNVLVMGHRFSDFDSLGGAVGISRIAEHFDKNVKIVVDKKTSLALPLIDKISESGEKELFLSPDEARSYVGDNTLLVIVDTHRQAFTESPELVDMVKKKVVIDHHRKSVDYIEDTVVFHHMPNASSASEMIADIVQYADTKPFLDSIGALSLLSGIALDTRNFVIRTGVSTFEAAAYLKSRNANTVAVKKLFSNDMDIFRMRNAVIDSAEKYRDCCAVSIFESASSNIRLITSQAADEMLNIEGVKASFVLYVNGNDVNISARSFGEINVQLIMEGLGGGGHQSMSACQLSNTDLAEARTRLEKEIDKYLDK